MRTRRFTLALVAILAALAALAACGGEDGGLGNRSLGSDDTRSDDTSSDDTSSDDTSSDDTSSDDTSSDDTSPDDTSTDDTSSDDTGGGDGGEFCELYNTYTEGASDLLSGEASPDELRAVYQELDEIAGPMADSAPAEINDDVNTLLEVAYIMGDVLADHDFDITEAMTDPALTDAFNEEYLDAAESVDEYVSTNC